MNRIVLGEFLAVKSLLVFAGTNFVPVHLHEICEFSSTLLRLINIHKYLFVVSAWCV